MNKIKIIEQDALPQRQPLKDPELRNGLSQPRLKKDTELTQALTASWSSLSGNPSDNDELIALLQNFQTDLGYLPLNPINNLSDLEDVVEALTNLQVATYFLPLTGGRVSGPVEINSQFPLRIISRDMPDAVSDGMMEFDGKRLHFTPSTVRKAIPLASHVIDESEVLANDTTETTIFTAEVAANTIAVKHLIKLILAGRYSTANGTDTLTIRFKVGGVTILSMVSTAASVTNAPLFGELMATIRSLGAGGTLWPYLKGVINNVNKHATGTATTTIDTASDVTFTITAQWSNADAGNTLSVDQALLEMN